MAPQGKTPSLKNGTILNGKWEIIEHIATGGKGEVYHARQTNLDREVVVKTISREYLGELEGDEEYIETELQRFHREALAMAKVRHPYIVQVYDQDEAFIATEGGQEPVQYLVMEYIDGPSLRSTMPSDGFCASEQHAREWIEKYFLPVLDGIQSIHDLDIVHRDIKPENVLLENSTPKIMDFGIAGGAQWSRLTKSHHVEGTITYMAPEQFMDLGETDVRADVYALGKILYEAVIGTMDKKTAFLLKSACLQAAESPFWKRVDRIIRDATTEDPDQRIPSAKALRAQLEALLEDFDETKLHFLGATLPRPDRRQIALGIAAIALIIGLIIISNLVHHAIMIKEEHVRAPGTSTVVSEPQEEGTKTGEGKGVSQESSIIGIDGSDLRYVPGGDFALPSLSGSKSAELFRVAPFFMASTEVTNVQYVRFLNAVLDRISVENGVVKSNGQTWLLLGEAFSGYEPIVFENGRFSLKNSRYRSYPVIRVTGYGAAAYARFYHERLPTELEWYAASQVAARSLGTAVSKDSKSHERQADLEQEMDGLVGLYGVLDKLGPQSPAQGQVPSQVPHEVSKFPENRYGIRGLRANVGEWGLRIAKGSTETPPKPEYVIFGDLEGTWLLGSTLIRGSKRDPSEASISVGFRVTKRAELQDSGQEQENVRQK